MGSDYHNMGFMFHVGIFLLAGFIGRYRIWPAVALAAIIVPVANLITGGGLFDVAVGITTGLLAGACGALIIPLFWAGRHGSTACGIWFLNNGGMGRSAPYFNWIKGDNHPDNQSGRKRWTENKQD